MGDTINSALHVSILKSLKTTLINQAEGEKWYDFSIGNEKLLDVSKIKKESTAEKAEEIAGLYLKIDTEIFESKQSNKSEAKWLATVFKEGTQADKMSAVQLKVVSSPVHSLGYMNSLIDVVQKKALRESSNVLKVLVELFENELLPPDRKLVPFNQRPFYEIKEQFKQDSQKDEFLRLVKRLILWKFESDLKKCYEKFIRALESLSGTAVEGVAEQACIAMANLLTSRSEQEKFLLESLVNKLGHPNHKIGPYVAHLLEKLAQKHPNMRSIIIGEVDRLIFRKNISEKAQFYGIHFLSRILLNAGESELAVKLLKIYFNLFKILIGKEQKNHKILVLVFIGTNRALPYAKEKSSDLSKEVDSLYNIVHTSEKLQISLSALKLLFQLLNFNEGLSDRFYSAFYRKLNDVHSSPHDQQLFDLLLKVLKHDTVDGRMRAFLKRLFQLALAGPPSFAAASLLLCSKLLQERPKFKLTADLVTHQFKADPEIVKKFESDSEEEHYEDVKMEVDGEAPKKGLKNLNEEKPDVKNAQENGHEELKGWVHRNAKKAQKSQPNNRAMARNPLFCTNASLEPELHLLSKHYHPSVAVFAQNILSGTSINYSGDPLIDFTTMRFLDRFSFKNPKVNDTKSHDPFNKNYTPQGVKKLAPTSQEYVSKRIEEIPIDERYLHRFATMKFTKKLAKDNKKDKKLKEDDDFDDVASINSDEFDLIMDQFEPGERNEEFEVDFAQELSQPKPSKKDKKKKRKTTEDDEEDMDMEDDEDEEDMEDEDVEFSGDDDSEMEDEEGFSDEEEEGSDFDMDEDEEDLDEVDFENDSEEEAPKKKKIAKPKGFKPRKYKK
uniref:CCAAT-binding factor domain-containing protein n=1 Tax=Acrobeloides nanus TaxID=290746 RepID=A0A914CU94_9BILA